VLSDALPSIQYCRTLLWYERNKQTQRQTETKNKIVFLRDLPHWQLISHSFWNINSSSSYWLLLFASHSLQFNCLSLYCSHLRNNEQKGYKYLSCSYIEFSNFQFMLVRNAIARDKIFRFDKKWIETDNPVQWILPMFSGLCDYVYGKKIILT
jgi:hypothetical protein